MFCFKCGKEIPDSSIYCQYCGTNLKGSSQVNVHIIFDYFNRFVKHNRLLSLLLGIWIIIHLCILLISSPTHYERGIFVDKSAGFFPFNDENILAFDINVYDFSEFIFYAVLIPFLIIIVSKNTGLFRKLSLISKHKTACSIYAIWVIINFFLYILSPNDIFYPKYYFYPLWGTLSELFVGRVKGLSLDSIGSYDSLEFFIYALIIPLFILCLITVLRFLLPKGRKMPVRSFPNNGNIVKSSESYTEQKELCQDKEFSESNVKIEYKYTKVSYKQFFGLIVGDIIICCITTFVCFSIWGFWLFSAFGSSETTLSSSFQEGSLFILFVIIIVDIMGLSIALFRYKKRNLPFYYFFSPFVILEIMLVSMCLGLDGNVLFGFLDYLAKAMIYLSIINILTIIVFLSIQYRTQVISRC